MEHSATYSPEDNKLRLYPACRLDKEEYERVRAAGLRWAPKQELFVCPAWSPSAEDLLLELCGEIGDEDTSLVDRAEQRADRFTDYSHNRAEDADQARKAVAAIADNIPLGQPILVGHHSEKHARRDAAKIENGMRRAVKMWEQSNYWKDRAHGAIAAAKYKELPAVRARRIKGLEADQRRHQRTKDEAERFITSWNYPGLTLERAKKIANFEHIYVPWLKADYPLSDYEGPRSTWDVLDKGIVTPEQARARSLPIHQRSIEHANRWLQHLGNRLEYERAMLAEAGGIVADRTKPEKGGGCRCWASPRGGWSYIQKVNKVSVTVLDNWGNGGPCFTRNIPFDKLSGVMTAAEVEAARAEGRLIESEHKDGFFLREAPAPDTDVLPAPPPAVPQPEPHPDAAEFEAMRDNLRSGSAVQVVSAPQLFPTPAEIAARMVELAELRLSDEVLEPSAGTGAITWAILQRQQVARLVAVEINAKLADNLRASHGFEERTANTVKCADFLECNGDLGTFDRVLMNPPFENGADIKHIRHALEMLKPGGKLVAICANGPRQQEQLQPLADSWEELPEGTFAGTGVRTVLLTITKAEGAAPLRLF